jgi:two-component system, sensor histidine kinase and response regulator
MTKVLVVEDSADVRENIVDLLEVNGYTVYAAENGYVGFQIAKAERPDLVISDVMMPIMDGFEMLRNMRENNSTAAIPLIMLTARSAATDIRRGMVLGADDYITKPFQSDDILNAVTTQLNKKKKIDEKFEVVYTALSHYIPHELRTPLVSIVGFTKIMLEELNELNKEELKELLLKVDSSSMRLQRTIEKFILFSESETFCADKNRFDFLLKKKTLVFESLIKELAEDRMRMLDSEHPVNIFINETELNIADIHFTTIIGELIENAVKFSYPKELVEIRLQENNSTVTFSIRNNGRGMTPDEIDQIAPFNQINRSKYEQSGNGLGLMIVKKLCLFYEIGFEIKSEPGIYTEVILKFPKQVSV